MVPRHKLGPLRRVWLEQGRRLRSGGLESRRVWRHNSDRHWIALKILPEWRVYILGAALCVALTICSRNSHDRGGPHFLASLTVAGIAYLLGVRELFAAPGFPRRVIVVGLVLAALWHIEFLRLPAGVDDDIHRYVWDGRLQRLGYNP